MIEKIKKFFSQKENVILTLFVLVLAILLISLFISNFNLLKVLIFISLILTIVLLIYFLQLQRKPREEKTSFFFSFFQNLLDYLQEGIVVYDDEFKIIFANKSFCEIVNLNKEDLINLIVKNEMIKNERYQTLANIFFPFLEGENLKIVSQKPETIEVKFSQPREKYFLISYVDIYLDKKYKLRIVLDKTEDVIEAQKRLEFIQMVSHNLLTPLSEIRWNLEAVDLNKIPQEEKDFLEIALGIIKSTIVFAESTLTMVETEFGQLKLKIEEVDLEKIIVSLLDILRGKIEEKKLKVNVEIEEKISRIQADRRVLSLMLFALMENSVLYNKMGGSVMIKAQKMAQRPYLEIIIEDTGIGMSKEDLTNLFKKYYRGKKAKDLDVKGFGVGLYNAKRLANLHGGDVKIESQEDKGTKAVLILPLDLSLIPGL
jgi:two-component system, OmpR family, phosphate regulon sensor histidine kinase PhoR